LPEFRLFLGVEKKRNGMQEKTFLLIANGDLDCDLIRSFDRVRVDAVIAADGGALHLLGCGIVPDVVIGDLDSIPPALREKLPETEFILRPSQELNDLEKALIYCREQGAGRLIILGTTGYRTDHSINNFSVLARYRNQFRMEIYDHYAQIFIVSDEFEYRGSPGQIISLIPVGKVEGITTYGLKYPLKNETLEFGIREGLSNVIVQNPVRISVQSGLLLVFANRMTGNDQASSR